MESDLICLHNTDYQIVAEKQGFLPLKVKNIKILSCLEVVASDLGANEGLIIYFWFLFFVIVFLHDIKNGSWSEKPKKKIIKQRIALKKRVEES